MSTMRLDRTDPENRTAATEPPGGTEDVRWPQPSPLEDWWQRVMFGAAPATPDS